MVKSAKSPMRAKATPPVARRTPPRSAQGVDDGSVERLEARLAQALNGDGRTLAQVCALAPVDRGESLRVLSTIYTAQLQPARAQAVLDGAPRLSMHPAVEGLKWRLETQWLEQLSRRAGVVDSVPETNASEGLRTLVLTQGVNPIYSWLAKEASAEQLVTFIASEGGPDEGVVELVAAAQVGASSTTAHGLANLGWELAGEGVQVRSRNHVHRSARSALGIERLDDRKGDSIVANSDMSDAALERTAVRGLLASNPGLRPELLGYVAMALLQAPSHAELVLKAMRRLRVPSEALRLYEPFTEARSRAGVSFVADVVKPAAREIPDWSHRIIRGARWRACLDAQLLSQLHDGLREGKIGAPRAA